MSILKMAKIKTPYHKKKSHFPMLAALAVVILLIIGAVILLNRPSTETTSSSQTDTINEDGDIDFSPATQEDQDAADKKKEEALRRENQEPADPNNKKDVAPVITFVGVRNGNAEVRSFISEIYEDTGKCTATFTKGNEKITRTVEGIKDVSYTRCDRVVVPVEEFGSQGGWQVVITYDSPTASGTSESREVDKL